MMEYNNNNIIYDEKEKYFNQTNDFSIKKLQREMTEYSFLAKKNKKEHYCML